MAHLPVTDEKASVHNIHWYKSTVTIFVKEICVLELVYPLGRKTKRETHSLIGYYRAIRKFLAL